jgi:hypothetical protein
MTRKCWPPDFLQSVQGRDVCVIQSRQQLRLALESRNPVRIPREYFRQNLYGDIPTEPRVAGPIDFPHPAGADQVFDAIMRNISSDHGLL